VLEVVAHYKPSGEAEVYDIMNALEDRMGSSNSAVVIAAVKVFLHLTLDLPATHQQVGIGCLRLCVCGGGKGGGCVCVWR
jgi:hypothetical protein